MRFHGSVLAPSRRSEGSPAPRLGTQIAGWSLLALQKPPCHDSTALIRRAVHRCLSRRTDDPLARSKNAK
jgi:hypothetical protein